MNNVPVTSLVETFIEGKTVCAYHLSPVLPAVLWHAVHTQRYVLEAVHSVTCSESSFILSHVDCFVGRLFHSFPRNSSDFQFFFIPACCREHPCDCSVKEYVSTLWQRMESVRYLTDGDLKWLCLLRSESYKFSWRFYMKFCIGSMGYWPFKFNSTNYRETWLIENKYKFGDILTLTCIQWLILMELDKIP